MVSFVFWHCSALRTSRSSPVFPQWRICLLLLTYFTHISSSHIPKNCTPTHGLLLALLPALRRGCRFPECHCQCRYHGEWSIFSSCLPGLSFLLCSSAQATVCLITHINQAINLYPILSIVPVLRNLSICQRCFCGAFFWYLVSGTNVFSVQILKRPWRSATTL